MMPAVRSRPLQQRASKQHIPLAQENPSFQHQSDPTLLCILVAVLKTIDPEGLLSRSTKWEPAERTEYDILLSSLLCCEINYRLFQSPSLIGYDFRGTQAGRSWRERLIQFLCMCVMAGASFGGHKVTC